MSLVDLDEVPDAKSSLSTSPTRSPRVAASSATPQPVAPPPMTRISRGLAALEPISAASWAVRDGTAAKGSAILCLTSATAAPPRSLAAIGGLLLRTVKYAPPATAAAAPRRRRRMEAAAMGRSELGNRWRCVRIGVWEKGIMD